LIALIILPLYLIFSLFFISPWWLAILIFLSIPFAGLYSWNYYLLSRRISGGLRIRSYIRKKNEDYLLLKKDHEDLMMLVSKLSRAGI
jgi:hypothetical protein